MSFIVLGVYCFIMRSINGVNKTLLKFNAWLTSHQNKRHTMVQTPLQNQGLFWREKPGDAKSDIRRFLSNYTGDIKRLYGNI